VVTIDRVSLGSRGFGRYNKRMSTVSSQKLMTAEELFARSSQLGRCELIEGELVKMSPTGESHAGLAGEIGHHLRLHVKERDLGKVYPEVGFLLARDPDTVREPDVAYIAKDRLPEARGPKFIPIPPDLAVEVNSPNDTAGDVVAKVQLWLAHGTRAVWVVDPKSKTVTTYHPDGSARVVHHNQTLTGGDVLPGFELPLSQLFND